MFIGSLEKNNEIQRLRGVAVIMVIVTHGLFLHLFPEYMRQSFSGVDVFFAISGYVVTLSLLKLLPAQIDDQSFFIKFKNSLTAIKTFYIRRAFRILPLAIVWLFIYLALSFIFSSPSMNSIVFGYPENVFKEILGFFSGIYNYLVSYGLTGNVSPYWSLAVEEQFYVVLPLLFIIFSSLKKRLTILSVLLCVLILLIPFITAVFTDFKFLKLIYAQRYFTLIFGVLLALLSTINIPSVQKKNITFINYMKEKGSSHFVLFLINILSSVFKPFIVISIIIILWALPGIVSIDFTYNMGFVVTGLFSALLVYLASLRNGWILDFPFISKFLEFVGDRSYFIYLSHFAFIRLNDYIYINLNLTPFYMENILVLTIKSVVTFVEILFFSQIFYKYFESPLIKLGKMYIKYKYTSEDGVVKI